MPPTPPPATMTFFLASVSFSLYLSSCSDEGFSAQDTFRPRVSRPKQPLWQPMQGRMSSTLPSRTLLTHSLSARKGLARATASTFPVATASSATSGSPILPETNTGIFVKFLI